MNEVLCDAELKRVIDFVYEQTGIRMNPSKGALLQGRLRSRIAEHHLKSMGEYLDLLLRDRNELTRFIDVVTTHETYFHRTNRVWEYLANDYLPAHKQSAANQNLSIWSAASSTGEEAYTIAMYCEEFARSQKEFHYSIYATDISKEVLTTAQKGYYHGRSLDALKKANPLFVEKYLAPREGGEMEVKAELKSKIKFCQQNLFKLKDVNTKFDIIFLRNVLFYFDLADQERVISHVEQYLNPDGVLIIGESESLGSLNTSFEYVQPLVYSRKKAA